MSLKGEVERKENPKAVRAPCISKETWRLADWRARLLRAGQASTREVCKAQRNFQRVLQEDRRQRVRAAGLNIEGLMVAGRVKEAWDQLERWYCHAWGKQTHHIREDLDQESVVREEIYRCRPPERLKVPILVQMMEDNNQVPTEAEVELAVRGMILGIAGGPSGMISYDLKGWCKEANW